MLVLPFILSASCDKINMQSNGESTLYNLLIELSHECKLNVSIKDNDSLEYLHNNYPIIFIDDLPLEEVIKILLEESHLFYEQEKNLLRIYYTKIETFKIDYVATQRSSMSSTEVSISRNDGNFGFHYGKYNGEYKDIFEKSGGSRSGVNIITEDEFNFWENIKEEIEAILQHINNKETKKDDTKSNVIINKGAGLITIKGNKNQIKKIENYIYNLQNYLSRQVLIDLNILNVTHQKSDNIGIDWNQLYSLQNVTNKPMLDNTSGESFLSLTHNETGTNHSFALNFFSQEISLNRVIEFLKTYGEVHTLSNPKLLTLNNQPAMISVGDVIRYRKNTVFQSNNSSSTINTNTDTEYPSIFAGILLDITPSIFEDKIMLKINPSITNLKGKDIENAAQALDSPPNLSTNQLSSIINVTDGKQIIIGGLINKHNRTIRTGIPFLKDIPFLKYLFSYEHESEILNEMVIIITPYIVNSESLSKETLNYSPNISKNHNEK